MLGHEAWRNALFVGFCGMWWSSTLRTTSRVRLEQRSTLDPNLLVKPALCGSGKSSVWSWFCGILEMLETFIPGETVLLRWLIPAGQSFVLWTSVSAGMWFCSCLSLSYPSICVEHKPRSYVLDNVHQNSGSAQVSSLGRSVKEIE